MPDHEETKTLQSEPMNEDCSKGELALAHEQLINTGDKSIARLESQM